MSAHVPIRLPQKPSFEEFLRTCTPLYRNPSLEKEMQDRVDSIVSRLQALKDEYGITFTKGQVALLGKEVDHVVPSFEDPCVLIMSSYMETTSSGQTARANEQQAMYAKLREHHIRYGKE